MFISHIIAQSLLSFLNLEFQIPDIHSCNKYLLSKFRVPGTLQQITKSPVSALPSWCLCLFGKVFPLILFPLILLSGYTLTELTFQSNLDRSFPLILTPLLMTLYPLSVLDSKLGLQANQF